jgi:eukaryotic-like serine/threonine-protein kinase
MTADSTTVGQIVSDWADRLARGESIAAEDELAQYPELAGTLRALLTTLRAVSATEADATLPVLPGFRVVREIGRGGMGVVYEAEDTTLGRQVAVKVLPPHLLGRPEYVARFRQEARAAAGLHHTHIVPVFGVGEWDGSHHIVMQYIAGRPPARGTVRTSREVAELGAKLADALAFAHAHGVLHRDVKPGNVLIDSAGEPWLADFGLARVESHDAFSDPTGFVGTVRYAAPERFHSRGDDRSDLYSLGLSLYELATGRPAFDAADQVELTRQVMEGNPPHPRSVNPAIPRDLETVLLTAVARNPDHRYPTAAAFADDLRRVADGRPILAKRIGPAGRLWRWAKRHPVVAGLCVAVVLSLALGLAGVGWQWQRAEQRRGEADQAFQDARDVVDDCYLAATEHDSFQGPGLQPAKEELLRRARKYYERFLAHRGSDPSVRADVAKARLALGTIISFSGQFADAIPELQAALGLYDQLGDHLAAARCQRLLGQCHQNLGHTTEAGEANTAALARLEPLLASDPAARLEFGRVIALEGRRLTETFQNTEAEAVFRRGLKALDADTDTPVRLTQTRLHYGLSIVLKRLNRVPEAGVQVKRMDDLAQGLLKLDPNRDDYLEEAGFARKAVGSFALMHTEEGKKHGWWHTNGYRDGADYYRRLHQRHPTVFRYHANYTQAVGSLGLSLWIDQKYPDSETAFRESLQEWERIARDHFGKPDVTNDFNNTRQDYSILLRTLGRFDEAREQYELAIRSQQGLIEKHPTLTRYKQGLAIAKNSFGIVCNRQRDDPAALRLYTEAIDLIEAVRAKEPGNHELNWNAANFYYSRGLMYWRNGDREKAAADLARVTNDKHAWRLLFLRAFGGDANAAAEAEQIGTADPGSAVDAAAVIALFSTDLKLDAAERERLRGVAVKLLKGGEKNFVNQAYRVDFLTRHELDPLADNPDFQALRTSAAALDAKK